MWGNDRARPCGIYRGHERQGRLRPKKHTCVLHLKIKKRSSPFSTRACCWGARECRESFLFICPLLTRVAKNCEKHFVFIYFFCPFSSGWKNGGKKLMCMCVCGTAVEKGNWGLKTLSFEIRLSSETGAALSDVIADGRTTLTLLVHWLCIRARVGFWRDFLSWVKENLTPVSHRHSSALLWCLFWVIQIFYYYYYVHF